MVSKKVAFMEGNRNVATSGSAREGGQWCKDVNLHILANNIHTVHHILLYYY